MTDPKTPEPDGTPSTQPPAYTAPAADPAYTPPAPAYGENPAPAYGENAPGYPAPPAYGAAPAYPAAGYPTTTATPGRTMGIVALVLAIVPIGLQLVGLILGIIALVQSRKAGQKNGMALAAIIVSSVLIVIGVIVGIILLVSFGNLANDIYETCIVQGADYYELWGQPVPCDSAR